MNCILYFVCRRLDVVNIRPMPGIAKKRRTMKRLRKALQQWQEIENRNAQLTPEQIKHRDDLYYDLFDAGLDVCCLGEEWCTNCHGQRPNRCDNCCVYTFGQFCAVCLRNIGAVHDEEKRIARRNPQRKNLINKKQLPKGSRVFIQM